MPVRSIRSGSRGVTGRLPSRTLKRMVAFESTLERDFYVLLDDDEDVLLFEEQPLTIDVGHREFTPDTLVTYRRGTDLVEVKYADSIELMPAKERTKFDENCDAARRYATDRGWQFRIATDIEIRGPRLDRARAVRRYLHPPPGFAALRLRILTAIRAGGATLATRLRTAGHTIVSEWHDRPAITRKRDKTRRARREIVRYSLSCVSFADVVFVMADRRIRDSLVEMGYALHMGGSDVVIIGDPRDLGTEMALAVDITVADDDAAVKWCER